MLFLAVIGGVVATGIVAIVLVGRVGAKAERRRLDTLYAWTMANGWQLVEGDRATSWRPRLAHLSRFGIRRMVQSVVHGLPVTVADCHYTSYSTDANGNSQSSVISLSVFVARLPGRWPDVGIRGKSLTNSLMRALTGQPSIKIGHPAFDKRFVVSAADPRAPRALLSPALVEAHVNGQAPAWSLFGGELMIVESGRLTPARILAGVERLGWLAEMLGYRAI